jgi:hypothetical protein
MLSEARSKYLEVFRERVLKLCTDRIMNDDDYKQLMENCREIGAKASNDEDVEQFLLGVLLEVKGRQQEKKLLFSESEGKT